jgi:hypothetical protein
LGNPPPGDKNNRQQLSFFYGVTEHSVMVEFAGASSKMKWCLLFQKGSTAILAYNFFAASAEIGKHGNAKHVDTRLQHYKQSIS